MTYLGGANFDSYLKLFLKHKKIKELNYSFEDKTLLNTFIGPGATEYFETNLSEFNRETTAGLIFATNTYDDRAFVYLEEVITPQSSKKLVISPKPDTKIPEKFGGPVRVRPYNISTAYASASGRMESGSIILRRTAFTVATWPACCGAVQLYSFDGGGTEEMQKDLLEITMNFLAGARFTFAMSILTGQQSYKKIFDSFPRTKLISSEKSIRTGHILHLYKTSTQ